METLQLKDIACYLPYKLKVKAPYGFLPNGKESTGVNRIVYLTGDLYADIENKTFKGEDFIPILKPMSDLYKPLGDGSIPIVELAKIAMPNKRNFIFNKFDKKAKYKEYDFMYSTDYEINAFVLFDNISDRQIHISNQHKLFDYLNEHHFDYRGLIEKGLAIDINKINYE